MCDWIKSGNQRIDPCMRDTIKFLQSQGLETLGSCCGHEKYPRTVIVRQNGLIFDYFTATIINRKKRFYKRDAQGIFFIPELLVLNPQQTKDIKP
jgi:hypothetical protein